MSFIKNLFGGNESDSTNKNIGINWNLLESDPVLDEIIEKSKSKPIIIFKHSTRCSISSMAKSRLERSWDIDQDQAEIYYLDLITYRSISNKIADQFGVMHQSPQVLVIKNGKSVYDTSHNSISVQDIRNHLN
ncbi:bacillithiol system redox-active protein YtxJ [Flexithrix dorotheae]|uniref:bacillithiol system redox-active protein YtxJ n=1 Tax=Flexithrix dorotheae TaxID=70993 RepID=UPI000375AE24|nr:bacillithiol system redox-active protein YtxJ [Flexithrix dorotheae]